MASVSFHSCRKSFGSSSAAHVPAIPFGNLVFLIGGTPAMASSPPICTSHCVKSAPSDATSARVMIAAAALMIAWSDTQ